MDRETLEARLGDEFDAEHVVVTIVGRQACDLADSKQFADDFGGELTVRDVVENLDDAPTEYTLVERWNWWLGALELSHGGYERFHVRPDIEAQL